MLRLSVVQMALAFGKLSIITCENTVVPNETKLTSAAAGARFGPKRATTSELCSKALAFLHCFVGTQYHLPKLNMAELLTTLPQGGRTRALSTAPIMRYEGNETFNEITSRGPGIIVRCATRTPPRRVLVKWERVKESRGKPVAQRG